MANILTSPTTTDNAHPIPRLPFFAQALLEIALVLACVYAFTPVQRNFDPQVRPAGSELSYLINSGVIASTIYRQTGDIPLWNPFIGEGEPLLENPFSFVLNPLMTTPFFLAEPVDGIKIGFLVHIVVAAIGGWVLGVMLSLRAPGRLMLALLIAGNGSLAGSVGEGFYQMSSSQTYIPWVLAALLGVIHGRGRWAVWLLVIASSLMIFAGTFWYVLPTTIIAAVWLGFALYHQPTAWRRQVLLRVGWAAVLVIGVTAVRWLPQAVHHHLVEHPSMDFTQAAVNPLRLAQQYVLPDLAHGFVSTAIHYHYILPPYLGLVLAGVLMWHYRRTGKHLFRHQVVIPSLLLIVLFTLWAQGATLVVKAIYALIPLMDEWRILGRMMAAATPLIAILIALALDAALLAIRDVEATWRRCGLLVVITGVSIVAAGDVLSNWQRVTGVMPVYNPVREPLYQLRLQAPGQFLLVETQGFYNYLPFYDISARAAYGNPDYRPRGMTPTYGNRYTMDYMAAYAVDFNDILVPMLEDQGYRIIMEQTDTERSVLWYDEDAPTYAYTLNPAVLELRVDWLTRDETEPIVNYEHHVDSVWLTVPASETARLLVITETAYPGWEVTVDGQAATVESVGELLGVMLPPRPAGSAPLTVTFTYRPVWLGYGALISLGAVLVLFIYALRLDRIIDRAFGMQPKPS